MLTTDAPGSVAQTLKHQTQENHLALEEMLLPQLNAIASHDDYIALLKAFYGYFKPLESLIDKYINDAFLPDVAQRRKAHYILQDLQAMSADTTLLAVAEQLPVILSVPQAMGALYVLEGSTLGGKGIAKMLLKNTSAGITENHLHFFNGYGAQTGSRWTSFVQVMDNLTTETKEIEAMCIAANQTFLYFKNWLQKQYAHG